MYGLHVDSRKTLNEIEKGWMEVHDMNEEDKHRIISESGKSAERPPLMLEPLFVILAGAAAAVVLCSSLNKLHSFTHFILPSGISNNRTTAVKNS